MANESCITYPPQSALIIIREPLMAICQMPVVNKEGEETIAPDPQAAAVILNQFIFWTDGKLSNKHQKRYHAAAAATENGEDTQDHSLWIYKNYDELKIDLLDLLGRNKVIENVQWLVLAGYLKCRTNPRYRWDKTLQYAVDVERVQSRINVAPSFTFKPSSVSNQTAEKRKNKRAIPEKTTEDTKEEEQIAPSHDAAYAPSQSGQTSGAYVIPHVDQSVLSQSSSSVEGQFSTPEESSTKRTADAKGGTTPPPGSAQPSPKPNAAKSLGAAWGVDLVEGDFPSFGKVASALIKSGIPVDEFPAYVGYWRERSQKEGWTLATVHALTGAGRMSEYVAYRAKQAHLMTLAYPPQIWPAPEDRADANELEALLNTVLPALAHDPSQETRK